MESSYLLNGSGVDVSSFCTSSYGKLVYQKTSTTLNASSERDHVPNNTQKVNDEKMKGETNRE